jgi:hypothetical protein
MYNFDENSHHQFAAEELSGVFLLQSRRNLFQAFWFKKSLYGTKIGVGIIVSSDLLICLHYKWCRHKLCNRLEM